MQLERTVKVFSALLLIEEQGMGLPPSAFNYIIADYFLWVHNSKILKTCVLEFLQTKINVYICISFRQSF